MGLHIILYEFSDDINDYPTERKDIWYPLRHAGDRELPHEIEWDAIEWEGKVYNRPKDIEDSIKIALIVYGNNKRFQDFCRVLDLMIYNHSLYFYFSY